jgi:hypothetical protein
MTVTSRWAPHTPGHLFDILPCFKRNEHIHQLWIRIAHLFRRPTNSIAGAVILGLLHARNTNAHNSTKELQSSMTPSPFQLLPSFAAIHNLHPSGSAAPGQRPRFDCTVRCGVVGINTMFFHLHLKESVAITKSALFLC